MNTFTAVVLASRRAWSPFRTERGGYFIPMHIRHVGSLFIKINHGVGGAIRFIETHSKPEPNRMSASSNGHLPLKLRALFHVACI